jgi:DNA repair exonuclease SbcCD nuclease subunit
MNFALISDLHLVLKNPEARLDNIVEDQFQKLEFFIQYAKEHDLIILQAGDFFDGPRSYPLLARVADTLAKSDLKIYSVYGQHDQYMRNRDFTSLDILKRAKLINILSDIPASIEYESLTVDMYGASFGEKIPKPLYPENYNILVVHHSIAMPEADIKTEFSDAKQFFKEQNEYNLILCGDIHRKFSIIKDERYIFNTGPMIRKTAEEYNFSHKPCFVHFNLDGTFEWIEIPHREAKFVLTRDHIAREKQNENMLDDFILEIGKIETEDTDVVKNMLAFIEQNDLEYEVIQIISDTIEEVE